MTFLDDNKKRLESEQRPKIGPRIIERVVPISIKNETSVVTLVLGAVKKIVIFTLFQSAFLVAVAYLSLKVPFAGTFVRYLFDATSSASHYAESLQLNEKIGSYEGRIEYLESLNKKLKGNLIELESEHPELFDEESNVKKRIPWKPALSIAVVALAGYFIKCFFFGGGSNAATAFAGTAGILAAHEEATRERHDSLLGLLGANAELLTSLSTLAKQILSDGFMTNQGIGTILECLLGNGADEGGDVTAEDKTEFLNEKLPDPNEIVFKNVPKIENGIPSPFGGSPAGSPEKVMDA